jgi:hypothetical protein
MAIINRRNALLGWAVWQTATRVAKHRAKSAVASANGGSKWRKRAAVAGAGVAAAGAAAMFWRKSGSGSDGESPADE